MSNLLDAALVKFVEALTKLVNEATSAIRKSADK